MCLRALRGHAFARRQANIVAPITQTRQAIQPKKVIDKTRPLLRWLRQLKLRNLDFLRPKVWPFQIVVRKNLRCVRTQGQNHMTTINRALVGLRAGNRPIVQDQVMKIQLPQ